MNQIEQSIATALVDNIATRRPGIARVCLTRSEISGAAFRCRESHQG
ncbi:MAG: hypothetical protein ABI307_03065 [Mycobacterium sp.]